jgi:hypothetical protein
VPASTVHDELHDAVSGNRTILNNLGRGRLGRSPPAREVATFGDIWREVFHDGWRDIAIVEIAGRGAAPTLRLSSG